MGEDFVGEEGPELEDYGRLEQAAKEAPVRQCLEAEQWVVSALWRRGWEVRVTPEHPLA